MIATDYHRGYPQPRLVAALILLIALIASAGCEKHGSAGVVVDGKLRMFIPPNTTMLAGIDVDALKATSFYGRHRELLDLPLLAGMSERTGFDLRRDLSSVLVMWNGKGMAIAARGRLAKDSIEHSLTGSPVVYKDYKLFRFQDQALTILNSDVVLGGNLPAVETAIDVSKNDGGGVPGELAAALTLLPKTNQIWLVTRGGLPFADVPLRSEYSSMLANFAGYIKSTSSGITVESGVRIKVRVDCLSEEGSKRVSDAIRGGIGLARLTTKDDQLGNLQLYDSVIVQKDGKTVNISADLPPEMADRLVNQLKVGSSR